MTKGPTNIFLSAFLLLVLLTTVKAQDPQATPRAKLTLCEAIQTALSRHPSLQRAREEIAAADARTNQARAGYFPQITTSAFGKQGLSGASGALGLRGLVTSPVFRDVGASAALFQNVFDFGRTAHLVRASEWAAVSLRRGLEAQQALVTLNVQRAYYDALKGQRLTEVSEKVLEERRLAVRQAEAFYKAQLKSKLDLTLAQALASQAELNLVRAREALKTARAELNHAMGVDGETAYELQEPDFQLTAPPDLEPLIGESLKQRPDLLAIDARIRADQEVVARAEKNRYPKIMLLFSGGWVRFRDYSPGKLLLGALGLDLPVFDAGLIKNVIAEAKANLGESQAARAEMAQDIRFEVQRAHNELSSSMEAVRSTEQLVVQAREALRLAQVRYRVQLGSFVELTAAEAAAASAEAEHAQALLNYKLAQDVLNYTAGRSSKR